MSRGRLPATVRDGRGGGGEPLHYGPDAPTPVLIPFAPDGTRITMPVLQATTHPPSSTTVTLLFLVRAKVKPKFSRHHTIRSDCGALGSRDGRRWAFRWLSMGCAMCNDVKGLRTPFVYLALGPWPDLFKLDIGMHSTGYYDGLVKGIYIDALSSSDHSSERIVSISACRFTTGTYNASIRRRVANLRNFAYSRVIN